MVQKSRKEKSRVRSLKEQSQTLRLRLMYICNTGGCTSGGECDKGLHIRWWVWQRVANGGTSILEDIPEDSLYICWVVLLLSSVCTIALSVRRMVSSTAGLYFSLQTYRRANKENHYVSMTLSFLYMCVAVKSVGTQDALWVWVRECPASWDLSAQLPPPPPPPPSFTCSRPARTHSHTCPTRVRLAQFTHSKNECRRNHTPMARTIKMNTAQPDEILNTMITILKNIATLGKWRKG